MLLLRHQKPIYVVGFHPGAPVAKVSTGIHFIDLGVGRATSPQEFSASVHSCQGRKPSHLTKQLVFADEIPEYAATFFWQATHGFPGKVVQIANVGLARLLLLDEKSPTTDTVMTNLKQIAESQPSAVGYENPGSHQSRVRALHAARKPLAGFEKLVDLPMTPRHRTWRGPLDSSEGAQYTPVQQSFVGCESQESLEHPPVVIHRVWAQMPEGLGQVLIDLVWIERLCLPREPAYEDGQLLQVSSGPADAGDVLAGKFSEIHGGTLRKSLPPTRGVASPRFNRYNPHPAGEGQLAQLVRTPVLSILRALLFALLTAAIWLPDLGAAVMAVSFRQLVFGEESLPKEGH